MSIQIATVAVEKTYFNYESDYDYLVPQALIGRVQVGARVQVGFGKGDARRSGFILALRAGEMHTKLKPILSLDDTEPFLTEEMVSLALWLKERTFTTTYDCLKIMLPRGLGMIQDATVRMVRLNRGYDPECLTTKKQKAVVELLEETGSANLREVCTLTGVTSSVIFTLEKKGVVSFFDNVVYRSPGKNTAAAQQSDIILTEEQAAVCCRLYDAIDAPSFSCALLFGVTGSGKTLVFLKAIDHVLEQGKNVIVLVPEIALTPQTMSIFYNRYGDQVAVFHSALSLGERSDEFKRVKAGKTRIVIGTRSAVFAPLSNIGLIVMDEEQEHTYKSENSPRYHARDVARYRCAYHKGLLLLASATPSVETYSAAVNGKYMLCELKKRYGNAVLPQVVTVDMKLEHQKDSLGGAISQTLYQGLQERLDKNQQSILLINRRGYNTFVSCNACGHVITCPNCSISLTYHSSESQLMCHYCGHTEQLRTACPECGGESVRYSGFGTQRIEDELKQKLPQARVLRMDADTTTERFSHEKKFASFAAHHYDILLGTQMVAKGLDFPNVTLVGVVNADNALYNENYTAGERAFSLLTQVVGRSGRGEKAGSAIIQTITPEHPVITLAAQQDYPSFYDMEIQLRRLLTYPPYCDIFVIGFSSTNENTAAACAGAFFHDLVDLNQLQQHKLILLGPSPAKIVKINGKYRYRIIIKCKNSKEMRAFIKTLLIQNSKKKEFRRVTAYVDFNPEDLT